MQTLSGVLIGGPSKVPDRTTLHGHTYLGEEMLEGQPDYESMVFSLRASVTFKHPLEVGEAKVKWLEETRIWISTCLSSANTIRVVSGNAKKF